MTQVPAQTAQPTGWNTGTSGHNGERAVQPWRREKRGEETWDRARGQWRQVEDATAEKQRSKDPTWSDDNKRKAKGTASAVNRCPTINAVTSHMQYKCVVKTRRTLTITLYYTQLPYFPSEKQQRAWSWQWHVVGQLENPSPSLEGEREGSGRLQALSSRLGQWVEWVEW